MNLATQIQTMTISAGETEKIAFFPQTRGYLRGVIVSPQASFGAETLTLSILEPAGTFSPWSVTSISGSTDSVLTPDDATGWNAGVDVPIEQGSKKPLNAYGYGYGDYPELLDTTDYYDVFSVRPREMRVKLEVTGAPGSDTDVEIRWIVEE